MDSTKLNKVTAELKDKYPEVGIQKIEVDEKNGRSTFFVSPTEKVLATLPPEKAVNLHGAAEAASTLRRNVIDRSVLDLIKKSVSEEDPHEIFKRAIKYYDDTMTQVGEPMYLEKYKL